MWVLSSDLTAAADLVAYSFLLCTLRHDLKYWLKLDGIFVSSCFEISEFGHVQHWIEMCTKGQIPLLFPLPHRFTYSSYSRS